MIRWASLATEGADNYSIDWSQRLPSGISLSSVAYTPDPDSSNIAFSAASVASNISTITITATKVEAQYKVKCVPTLSSGSISGVTIEIKVVKHKPAR